MKTTKKHKRAEWILANKEGIKKAREKYQCPEKCRSSCGNGATCFTSSGGGWGYWVQAFTIAKVRCDAMNYWSGSAPTPSTSINRGIAEYITKNAPNELS